ncbi:MAG: hypothetical protein EBQ75_03830 [Actinobacteria bacterium]|nr:hypothetical protein [Actinomycetota bacterium]
MCGLIVTQDLEHPACDASTMQRNSHDVAHVDRTGERFRDAVIEDLVDPRNVGQDSNDHDATIR